MTDPQKLDRDGLRPIVWILLVVALWLALCIILMDAIGCHCPEDRIISIEERSLLENGPYPREWQDGSWLDPYIEEQQLRRFWAEETVQACLMELLGP